MTSQRRVPIFDGHNDVLLRLFRRGGADAPMAFLEGGAKGQLNLPMARQGGFAGGLFAIFVPSNDGATGPNGETPSRDVDGGDSVESVRNRRIWGISSSQLRCDRNGTRAP
jgi:membrane dipeptidase